MCVFDLCILSLLLNPPGFLPVSALCTIERNWSLLPLEGSVGFWSLLLLKRCNDRFFPRLYKCIFLFVLNRTCANNMDVVWCLHFLDRPVFPLKLKYFLFPAAFLPPPSLLCAYWTIKLGWKALKCIFTWKTRVWLWSTAGSLLVFVALRYF